MAETERCHALVELREIVDRITPTLGSSRAEQVRWVAGELERAVTYDVLPDGCCRNLASLFSELSLARYFRAADADDLRATGRRHTCQPSEHSAGVRRSTVTLIASAAGLHPRLPQGPQAPLRDPLTSQQRDAVWRFVSSGVTPTGSKPSSRNVMIRLCAAVGVVMDTGARSGELTSIQLPELAADLSHVTITRRPQRGARVYSETLALSQATQGALRHWLQLRDRLVAGLGGSTPTALWVSVCGGGRSHSGTTTARTRPGLPILPDVLRVQYASTTAALNGTHAGDPAWVMLPRRMEVLRRASTPNKHNPAGQTASWSSESNAATAA